MRINTDKEVIRMPSYNSFAWIYDQCMGHIPYDEWVEYLQQLIQTYCKKKPHLILDLGCGTGNITERLAHKGYDMIGVDNSFDMLSIAKEKAGRDNQDILYLLQDMRAFELYGTVDCIVSICDSMNYIMEEEDLLQVFKLVNNYLDPEGIFIFDLNTKFKYEQVLGEHTFAETYEKSAYIWENYYYEDEAVNEYDLTLFIEDDKNQYQRYSETHHQRMYTPDTIKKILLEAGLIYVDCFDAFTFDKPTATSERVYYIAREQGK